MHTVCGYMTGLSYTKMYNQYKASCRCYVLPDCKLGNNSICFTFILKNIKDWFKNVAPKL